jgi:DNA-binding NarL/FixJ family response regulator
MPTPTGTDRSDCLSGPNSPARGQREVSDERRCLVIDGHPVVRLGVQRLLEDRYEIEEAEDGSSGLEMVTDVGDFDVAIVDIARRGDADGEQLSGTAAIRALHKAQPGLGIVAHGSRPERHAATEAMDAGATAYVAKSSPADALTRAVEAAAEAETFVDPATRRGNGSARPALTRRQRQILQMIADGHSTSVAARRLGLSAETVRTHTKAVLARLGARDRAHAVAIGLRNSLID